MTTSNTHLLLKPSALTLALLPLGIAFNVQAADLTISEPQVTADNIASSTPTATLDTIVITATRTPTKTSNLIAQTTVIDEAELARHQGQTVLEVLKNQPDISIKQNGGMGTNSNFFLRGHDSKSVLVLIDGIRYGSVSTGQPAVGLLSADQIERIEILHGASGSSIYGADAVGGVIQIFTKSGNYNGVSVTAGIGSNEHYKIGATGTFSNGTTSATLSANHNQTKGINATLPTAFAYHPDKDGFESDNFSLALKHQFENNLQAGFNINYSDSTTDFDKNTTEHDIYVDQKNGSAQAYIDWSYQADSSIKLQYGRSIDDSINHGYDSKYNTTQDQLNLVGSHTLSLGQAIFGAEHLSQSLDSSAYEVDDRDVTSVFAGYQISQDKLDAQANARYDDNSQYGDKATYNLGLAYRPFNNYRVGASYATGFRSPTFNNLYYPNYSNPDLKPETSKNSEVFAEYAGDISTTRITGYHSDVKDMIASDANWKPANIAEAQIKGISLKSDWQVNNYLFGLGYDYQKVTDEKVSSATYDNDLYYRPNHKGLLYAGYQTDEFDIRTEYKYTGTSYSDMANTKELDNYGLVNLTGNYYLSDNVTLSSRINNLTNKKYVTAPDYNVDGTNVFASLTYDY